MISIRTILAMTTKPHNKNPWNNPSKSAIARVRNPLPKPTTCPCCGGSVELVENSEIYGKPYGDWPYAFLCTNWECRAYVSLHPFTDIPVGTLADKETRQARNAVKPLFNQIWKDGHMTRTAAYRWLAQQMGIEDPEHCHIGWFTAIQCRQARAICITYLSNLKKGATCKPTT